MDSFDFLIMDILLIILIAISNAILLFFWKKGESKQMWGIFYICFFFGVLFSQVYILKSIFLFLEPIGMLVEIFGLAFLNYHSYHELNRLKSSKIHPSKQKSLILRSFSPLISSLLLFYLIMDASILSLIAWGIYLQFSLYKLTGKIKNLFGGIILNGSFLLMVYWVLFDLGVKVPEILNYTGQIFMNSMMMVLAIIIVFEEKTQKTQKELEIIKKQRLESLGIMTGGIAHDFNNILVSLFGSIDLLEFTNLTEEQSSLVNDMKIAANQAKDLTQKFLSFSKSHILEKKELDIKQLIEDTVDLVGKSSNCSFEFNFTTKSLYTQGDQGQLTQVFSNLLINAIQAMPHGGIIKIGDIQPNYLNHLLQKDVLFPPIDPIDSKISNDYLIISIADQGSGISPQVRKKIFIPYFSTKSTGSGLGLATSRAIIKKHNGYICFRSTKKGTEFFVILPKCDSINPVQKENIHEFHGNQKKILVIDDITSIHKTLKQMARKIALNVIPAYTSEEAQRILLKDQNSNTPMIDYAIIDLTIPNDISGYQLALKLKEIQPNLKVIISSGHYNDHGLHTKLTKQGFALLAKPYYLADLIKVLNTFQT